MIRNDDDVTTCTVKCMTIMFVIMGEDAYKMMTAYDCVCDNITNVVVIMCVIVSGIDHDVCK